MHTYKHTRTYTRNPHTHKHPTLRRHIVPTFLQYDRATLFTSLPLIRPNRPLTHAVTLPHTPSHPSPSSFILPPPVSLSLALPH